MHFFFNYHNPNYSSFTLTSITDLASLYFHTVEEMLPNTVPLNLTEFKDVL